MVIFAQPGAERVPEIMAGERRQQLRFPLFLFGLFQLGFVVGHTDALDGAVDRLRILRLAEAVQEYEVRDSVDFVFAYQFQLLLVGAFLLQCLPHFGQDWNCPLAMKSLVANGEDLTVVGIVKPAEDAKASSLSPGIAYPTSLTKHVAEQAAKSEIVKQQLANPDVNVFTNKKFGEKDMDAVISC